MYHKISSMCDKIRVIYDKSEQLRIMKYGHPDDPNFNGEIAMVGNGSAKLALLELPKNEEPVKGSR